MATTTKGYPYPLYTAPADVPADIRLLAEAVDAAPGTMLLTTTQRDALTGGERWAGKQIWNLTLGRLEVYNGIAWQAQASSDHQQLSNRDLPDAHAQYALGSDLGAHANATDPHTVYILKTTAVSKGDILAAIGSGAFVRVPVGGTGTVLTSDAAASAGVKWAAAAGGSGSTEGTSLYKAGTQAVGGGEADELVTGWTELHDVGNWHPSSSNYIVAPKAGYCEVAAGIQMGATSGAQGYVHAVLKRGSTDEICKARVTGSSSQTNLVLGKRTYMATGQELRLYVKQNAGTSRDLEGGDESRTWMTISYLGA